MAKHHLTEKQLQNLQPRKTPYPDGGGVSFQVGEGKDGRINVSGLFGFAVGTKTSRTGKVYKAKGWIGLGKYGTRIGKTWHIEIPLAEIRRRGDEARALHNQGINPVKHRDDQKAAAKAEAAKVLTLDQCVINYQADQGAEWGEEHRKDWINSFANHVLPVIGSLPIALVDVPQILQVLRPIWRDKYVTANRIRERLEKVIGWAITSDLRPGPNPATMEKIKSVLGKPTHIVRHHAALSYREINALVADLLPRSDRDALALLLLIFTATRAGAVIGARAEEFDLHKRVWTVPAARMKRRGQLKEKEFRIPLSDAAMTVIERRGVKAGLLFPSTYHSTLAQIHGREGITIHGFRSCFKTWSLERTAFKREIIEIAMSHRIGDVTEESYVAGDALETRRGLMEAWAKFCATPWSEPETNNVVALRSA